MMPDECARRDPEVRGSRVELHLSCRVEHTPQRSVKLKS